MWTSIKIAPGVIWFYVDLLLRCPISNSYNSPSFKNAKIRQHEIYFTSLLFRNRIQKRKLGNNYRPSIFKILRLPIAKFSDFKCRNFVLSVMIWTITPISITRTPTPVLDLCAMWSSNSGVSTKYYVAVGQGEFILPNISPRAKFRHLESANFVFWICKHDIVKMLGQ